jgi:D-alanyl-D-alanine dipeptidase
MKDNLVPVNKYNNDIMSLSVFKRIAVDYPILVKDTVAKKLSNVANKLPKGITLQVDSGYRHPKVQKILWDTRYKQFEKKYPKLTKKEVEQKTEALVANPRKRISSHSTGGAVDISLVADGKELNLSAPLKKYYEEPQLRSKKITTKAQEMRLLLHKLMLEQGYAPNPAEYWHFSYGDKSWGNYYKKTPIYSKIELTSNYYYPRYKRIYYRIVRRFWKIINRLFNIHTNY